MTAKELTTKFIAIAAGTLAFGCSSDKPKRVEIAEPVPVYDAPPPMKLDKTLVSKLATFDERGYKATETITVKIYDDRSAESTQVAIGMDPERGAIQSTSTYFYDAKGKPLKIESTETLDGSKTNTLVTFAAWEAKVAVDGKEPRSVPMPRGKSPVNSARNWFTYDQPQIGDIAHYVDFNIHSLHWHEVTYRYEGRAQVRVRGKVQNLHKVSCIVGDADGEYYFDNLGQLVKFKMGGYNGEIVE